VSEGEGGYSVCHGLGRYVIGLGDWSLALDSLRCIEDSATEAHFQGDGTGRCLSHPQRRSRCVKPSEPDLASTHDEHVLWLA